MRTITVNLYDYEELQERSKERARLALLEDQDFKADVLRRLNVFACEDIQNCVNKKLQKAFRRVAAIHWGYNLVSVSVEVGIDSRALLRELADEVGYGKPVYFAENISFSISTDSLTLPKFDDPAITQIARWLFTIVEDIREKSEKRIKAWISDAGIQAYSRLYRLEFEENGKVFSKKIDCF